MLYRIREAVVASRMGFVVLLAAFWSGCMSTQPVAIGNNTYVLPPLGLSVAVPDHWQVVSAQEMRQAQRAADSTNETLNFIVYQSANVSFLTLHRTEPLQADVTPTFAIYREGLGEDRFASSEKVLGFSMHAYLEVLVGARIMSPPVKVKIGGQDYVYGRIMFPLQFHDGTKMTVERRFWVRATTLSAVIMTAAFDVRDLATVEPELDQILRSIQPASSKSAGPVAATEVRSPAE